MRVESLLSARLFIAAQLADGCLYFVSDLSGRLSLYRMLARPAGSVPEALLPPHIALQNPHLIGGESFHVFPALGQLLVMLDQDGDENYQPMLVPMTGGFPVPAFGDQLANYRVHATLADIDHNSIYLLAESRTDDSQVAFRGHLDSGTLDRLTDSKWGPVPAAHSADHSLVVINEGYTVGDSVLYLLREGETGGRQALYGTPIEAREEGKTYPLTAFFGANITPGNRGILLCTALIEDTYGPAYLDLSAADHLKPVTVIGRRHTGTGELTGLTHLVDDRYRVDYNIDGVSWLYEAEFDQASLELRLTHVLAGEGLIANGVLESTYYEKATGIHVITYSTATTPTQIYTVSGADRGQVTQHTVERVLGIAPEILAPGEDASFTSHDGLRISARLYLPSETRGFSGPRPLVYYVHGGPQGQERPDFAWFSMPLIQFLTLNGFAVFVPNARGSQGYGLSYTKRVDHDWGGQDRLDHVHAMTQVLPHDPRLDVGRAAVVGRSYGGYMTLMLAARHPELWRAACDMFGPYSLLSFLERIPPTWKPYFHLALGHPEKDRDFLVERSPATYVDDIACPLLVIQGKNDPRVVEPESRDLVERLRAAGRRVEYLVFENEGHDVLKFENKVRCYDAITDFFKLHLQP